MPYYLFQGRYSPDAFKAMVATPQNRETAGRKLVEATGGTLHHLFFAFGETDVVALAEQPDDNAMAATSMALAASGAFAGGTTLKLMTAAEAQDAMRTAQTLQKAYTPPTG